MSGIDYNMLANLGRTFNEGRNAALKYKLDQMTIAETERKNQAALAASEIFRRNAGASQIGRPAEPDTLLTPPPLQGNATQGLGLGTPPSQNGGYSLNSPNALLQPRTLPGLPASPDYQAAKPFNMEGAINELMAVDPERAMSLQKGQQEQQAAAWGQIKDRAGMGDLQGATDLYNTAFGQSHGEVSFNPTWTNSKTGAVYTMKNGEFVQIEKGKDSESVNEPELALRAARGDKEAAAAITKLGEAKREAKTQDPGVQGREASRLRQQFNGLAPVKEYRDVKIKFGVMAKAVEAAKTGDPKSYNYLDQAIVTLFNKLTDPNSVVRESEFARTPQGMALLSRAEAFASKIAKGGILNQQERQEALDAARIFATVYEDAYRQYEEEYRGYASLSGVNPDLVVKPLGASTIDSTSKGNRPLPKF